MSPITQSYSSGGSSGPTIADLGGEGERLPPRERDDPRPLLGERER